LTGGAGWAADSGGLLQEISSRLAQIMLMSKITKRNMARRITEGTGKIKQAKRGGEIFCLGASPAAQAASPGGCLLSVLIYLWPTLISVITPIFTVTEKEVPAKGP
jgi:hypothetical protein